MQRHCTLFLFDVAAHAATFIEWYRVFRGAQYSLDELNAASDEIARRSEPLPWLRDHLPHIHRSIRSARAKAHKLTMDDFRRRHGTNLSDDQIAEGRQVLLRYFARIGHTPKRSREGAN